LFYVVLLFTLVIGFVSLGVDWGRVQLAKTQLQAAADAAVRAACAAFTAGGGDVSAAQAAAVSYAAQNVCDGAVVALDANNDVEFGTWDPAARTFTTLTGSARSSANALRITARRTAATGNPIALTFGQALGLSSCDARASAIALPAGGYGIVGLNSISMSGNSTDSYSSAYNTDPTSGALHHGTAASNGDIALSGGSSIQGDAHPGIGKSVNLSGGSSVSGSTARLTTALSYPNATAGSYATTNDDGNIPGAYLTGAKDFNLGGGKTLSLPAGNYYFHNFTLQGGSALSFTGPATLWITGTANLGEVFTTYGSRPANLSLEMCSSGDLSMSINSSYTICASIYAPQSKLTLSNGNLAGGVVSKQLQMSGSAKIYFDESLTTYGATIQVVR
jgi:hypothetical protein